MLFARLLAGVGDARIKLPSPIFCGHGMIYVWHIGHSRFQIGTLHVFLFGIMISHAECKGRWGALKRGMTPHLKAPFSTPMQIMLADICRRIYVRSLSRLALAEHARAAGNPQVTEQVNL